MNERIKEYKDDIIIILFMLLGITFFTVVFKYKLNDLNYSAIKEKSVFLISVFSCIIYLISIFFSLKKGDSYIFGLKFLIPLCIGMSFCLINSEYLIYIPFILPISVITVYLNSSIAFLFQAFLTLVYYFSGVFSGELSVIYMFFSIFIIFIIDKSDSSEKYKFSGIIGVLGYIVLNYIYQLYTLGEVFPKLILRGLPALIVGIFPMYYKLIYDNLYRKILSKKILELSDDENELLLCLMDINSESYVHSLKVADTAVSVARKMDCDYELVNVSARFHEIGKIRGNNYVEDGIKILKENHFPREVITIVKEHNSKSNYPRTLESAIVMLSDSIETTLSKVMETNGYNIQHEKIISQIIDIRFDSGCLDYAIKDLDQFKALRKAFLEE